MYITYIKKKNENNKGTVKAPTSNVFAIYFFLFLLTKIWTDQFSMFMLRRQTVLESYATSQRYMLYKIKK